MFYDQSFGGEYTPTPDMSALQAASAEYPCSYDGSTLNDSNAQMHMYHQADTGRDLPPISEVNKRPAFAVVPVVGCTAVRYAIPAKDIQEGTEDPTEGGGAVEAISSASDAYRSDGQHGAVGETSNGELGGGNGGRDGGGPRSGRDAKNEYGDDEARYARMLAAIRGRGSVRDIPITLHPAAIGGVIADGHLVLSTPELSESELDALYEVGMSQWGMNVPPDAAEAWRQLELTLCKDAAEENLPKVLRQALDDVRSAMRAVMEILGGDGILVETYVYLPMKMIRIGIWLSPMLFGRRTAPKSMIIR